MRRSPSAVHALGWIFGLCVIGTMFFGPALAAGEERPAILNTEATNITEHGAGIEARIDPHGIETKYEIWLECGFPEAAPVSSCAPIASQEQGGVIAANIGEQAVTVNMVGLLPSYAYHYGVAAYGAAGRTEVHWGFTTQHLGACAGHMGVMGICPYKNEISYGMSESSRQYAEGALAREAERKAKAAAEQAEREAKSQIPSPESLPPSTVGASSIKLSSLSLAGIPQSNETLGSPYAPVKMLYFNSPSSPISQEWQSNVLPVLVRKYVRAGKLQIQWHGIDVIEPPTVPGDRFVAAAGLQNHLWDVLDDVMVNQGRLGTDWLNSAMLEWVGAFIPEFNVAGALAAASSPRITHELAVDARQAARDHVSGVPEFRLGRRGGPLRRLEYVEQAPREFESPIDKLLPKRER